MTTGTELHFFLGCNTPTGFVSLFDRLTDETSGMRTFIIKGGPGCGKSTVIRRAAERLMCAGHDVELIHCASDPASLDGVICPALGVAAVDGTSPHVLEPRYPEARERVVSLYCALDSAPLSRSLKDISALFCECRRLQERAARFSGAACGLLLDLERTAARFVRRDKLARYLGGLAHRLMPKKGGPRGRERLCFSGAFTPDGLADFSVQNAAGYSVCYVFCDRYYAASRHALNLLRRHALSGGYDVISCRSPLFSCDGYDSLYIPELSLCFLSSGLLGENDVPGAHAVHERRFYEYDSLAACTERLSFIKKSAQGLLSESARLMQAARERHCELEKHYIAALDFSAVDRAGESLVEQLLLR